MRKAKGNGYQLKTKVLLTVVNKENVEFQNKPIKEEKLFSTVYLFV
jgi:hypothetical protein